MSDKKNIDRLFQEKFKDFEAMPPEGSWANIEAKLDEKKRRRVIPLWWKLSGVAAIFLIGFLVSKSIYDDGIQKENPVVNQNNTIQKGQNDPGGVNIKDTNQNNGIQTSPSNSENPVVNSSDNNQNSTSSEGMKTSTSSSNSNNAVAASSGKENVKSASEGREKTHKPVYNTNTVAERKPSQHRSLKTKSNTDKNKALPTESVVEKSNNQVAQNPKKDTQGFNPNEQNNQSTSDKNIVRNEIKEKTINETPTNSGQKPVNLDDLKGNVNSKVASKETDKKANDTASTKSVAKNELEELLNEKESKLKKESKLNRWQLASSVAPIFLGSASKGSPIDSTLAKNPKSFNTSVGFGVGVSYAVNKKLSIRTGLNKVNMSYDTDDIIFFTGLQAKTLQNVSPNASSALIHVESTTVNSNTGVPSENGLLPFENSFVHKNSGYLRQEMGYLEMPVEMTYNLFDKKFGLKIIGGFSTLFLQDNSITIVSPNGETQLGKASNLNDVHFSTNFGLGLKYSFMKSFEFNVEPTLKYQLNTFNANAGSFKPYYFGVYSGISYKF